MYLYAFYLKIEPFLPWTILRFLFTFGKNSLEKQQQQIFEFNFLEI
jgi:hypothetical protein